MDKMIVVLWLGYSDVRQTWYVGSAVWTTEAGTENEEAAEKYLKGMNYLLSDVRVVDQNKTLASLRKEFHGDCRKMPSYPQGVRVAAA